MRTGTVVSIRVNPTDCMAVVDLVNKVGVYQAGMSFSSAVSAALASALQSLRDAGLLPERIGFEYNELMAQFPKERSARKLAIERSLHIDSDTVRASVLLKAPSTPERSEDTPSQLTGDTISVLAEQVARDRLALLYDKKEAGVVLGVELEAEYNQLMGQVYG